MRLNSNEAWFVNSFLHAVKNISISIEVR